MKIVWAHMAVLVLAFSHKAHTQCTGPGLPEAAFTYTASDSCGGAPVLFQNLSTEAVNYQWNFGDPASGTADTSTSVNPQHTFSYTGTGQATFPVTLTAINGDGCLHQTTQTVTVTGPPDISTPGRTTVCQNSTTFWLYSSPTGGTWAGPHITPSGWFSPTTPGTFTLVYTLQTGACQVSDTAVVIVHPLPVINAGNDTAVCIAATPFPLTGVPAGGTWDGMGITDPHTGMFSPAQAGVGIWPATYMYTDTNTCYQYDYRLIEVLLQPAAAFYADTAACTGADVSFVTPAAADASYTWSFGDGTQSSLSNPSHVYAAQGGYTVQLIVSAENGCSDTAARNIHVTASPQAAIVASSVAGCGPLSVDLASASTDNGMAYFWDFGNGNTSTSALPGTILYPASATADTVYTVTLTLSNTCGSNEASQHITVFTEPVAAISADMHTGCSPLTVQFTPSAAGNITGAFWDFGDGTVSTLPDPGTHTFVTGSRDTVYTVTVVMETACGSDTAYTEIHVLAGNVAASFTTDVLQGCMPLTVNFTGSDVENTAYEWIFGDSTTSVESTPAHTYQTPGTYTALLAVNNGCAYDTEQVTLTVFELPSLDFTAPAAALCQHRAVTFINTSPDPSGLWWAFGDGTTSVEYSPSHTYASAGTFSVSLTGTSAQGCTDSVSATVTVNPTPVVDISFPVGQFCTPYTISFSNHSQQVHNYAWDFGDGNTASGADPSHTYLSAGSYTVTVIGEHAAGCTDTATGTVSLLTGPQVAMGTPVSVCAGTPVQFRNQSQYGTQQLWHFGNGHSSTAYEPVYLYELPGTYDVTLIVSNPGCSDTLTVADFVTISPVPKASFTVGPDIVFNDHPLITLVSEQPLPGMCTYRLPNGEIILSCKAQALLTDVEPGVHTVVLVATNAFGCQDSAWNSVHVTEGASLFVPNAFTPNADGGNEHFQAYGTGIKTFEMTIVDRWGNLLFRTNDMNQGWDGKNRSGQTVKQDVYIWKISAGNFRNEPIEMNGRVTVIW